MKLTKGKWRCLQWTVAYLFLIVFMIAGISYEKAVLREHRSWTNRAKGTLRSIGSAQLAYRDNNALRVYGSFEALKKTMYIAEGYTQSNMIENYSIEWRVSNISTVASEEFPSGTISTFTIIAWPLNPRDQKTYAITEDQAVRVYNPRQSKLDDLSTWDPIL